MIRAVGMVLALGAQGAQADIPSPLFCETLEVCEDAQSCVVMQDTTPFVMRHVDNNWVMQFSPRGTEFWVIIADSAEVAVASSPEGARLAMIAAGTQPDGVMLFHEHSLETGALSARFGRHACQAEANMR